MNRWLSFVLSAAGCWLVSASGVAADAGSTARVEASCVESLPAGKERPKLSETFPARGDSGHAASLELTIEHLPGETVMPNGVHVDLESSGAAGLRKAHFIIPDPDGGAGPIKTTEVQGGKATTRLTIPFVPLPPEAGRHHLILPALPVAVARASGDIITLCTREHEIVVDDPIANTPHATPRPNPEPRRQLEEWTTLKYVVYGALIALVVAALTALLARWLLKRYRSRPAPPPPPSRPPWEVALEELFDIRHAGLISAERYAEYYERVSYTVRKYLGDRYGFDGLESTTREILAVLGRVVPRISVAEEIEVFLREADLVKFARLTPSQADCELALERGERIVRRTVPDPRYASAAPGAPVQGPPPPVPNKTAPPPPGDAP